MGGCVSLPKTPKRNDKHRSSSFRTRFKGLPPDSQSIDGHNSHQQPQERKTLAKILMENEQELVHHRYHQSRGSREDLWFDAEARFVSDSDDEFMSVYGDAFSIGSQTPKTPRPTFASLKEGMSNGEPPSPGNITSKGRVSFSEETMYKVTHDDELGKRAAAATAAASSKNTPRNSSVSVAPVSDASAELDAGKYSHHTKTEFEGCLPCLLNTVVSNDRKSPPQRKKSFRLFSFKRRSSFDLTEIPDTHNVVTRPVACSQVPEEGWSTISPSTFKLRSQNYMKDRKKVAASSIPIFEIAGVDVFLSPKKIDHITRFVDISHLNTEASNPKDNFPSLFIFNIQVPLYTASVFPSENDGEGLNLVFYYRLSEEFRKDGPPNVKDLLTKFLNDDHEKIKGLVGETNVPFRERLKIVARVLNPDEIHLSTAERKLVVSYNEKPVLSRPQHVFFKGDNYFEVDLDVHRFNFIARKAVETFRERLKFCILDIGLTIQGNKSDELPEYMLCCARVSKLNITDYKYLSTEDAALTPR